MEVTVTQEQGLRDTGSASLVSHRHVLALALLYPGPSPCLSQLYPESIPALSIPTPSRVYPSCIPSLSRLYPSPLYPGPIPTLSGVYPGSVPSLFQLYPHSIPALSRVCPGSIPALSRLYPSPLYPCSILCLSHVYPRSIPALSSVDPPISWLYPVSIPARSPLYPGSIPALFRPYPGSIPTLSPLYPVSIPCLSPLYSRSIQCRSRLYPVSIPARSPLYPGSIPALFRPYPESIPALSPLQRCPPAARGRGSVPAAAQAEAAAEAPLAPLPGGRRGGSSGQNEVQPLCDLGPQQEPQTAFQCPLPHPQENHVLAPVQGAAAEVQRALHAHPQGRRGPGGEGTLQGPADREGGAGVQEEIRDLHRARAAREGQRHHRARGHPPQQGGDHQAKAGQGPQEDPGAQSQVPPGWQGEGQVQGGDNREDAGIAAFLSDTIKKLLKFNLLCVFFQIS